VAESTSGILQAKAVSGLMAPRRTRRYQGPLTALEVDGPLLRVVSASGRGVITHVAAEPLNLAAEADRADAEALGRAIGKALGRLGIKPGAVVMGVPRASVLLRTLSLPVLAQSGEVAAMVHLQVSKELPFRMDEAVIDFKVRGAFPTASPGATSGSSGGAGGTEAAPAAAQMEVLVAVVRRAVVEFYRQAAAAAGVKLVALGLLPYANARCVAACHVAADAGAVAILTLRADEVGIDVAAYGALLFSRGASFNPPGATLEAGVVPPGAGAGGGPTEVELAPVPAVAPGVGLVEAVTIEVVRSLHSYGGMEAQYPVSKVVVAGATGQEQAVVEALRTRLSIPCEMLDVAQSLNLSRDAGEPAAYSIPGVGLALGANDEAGLPFDFLNPKRPAVPRDLRTIRLVLGTLALLAVVLFIFGLRTYKVNQRLKQKARLGQELIDAKKKRPIYAQMRQQLGTVREWTQGGRNWLEHYAYLSAVLPPCEEVYVTSLSISGSGAIRLSVQARSGQVLAKLDKQLRAAGYEVKPLAITPGEEKLGYGFRSTVELEVPEKLRLDLGKARPPQRPADDASLDGARRGGAQ
jgi:Tfp pilus assembly PilM family ATPase